MPEYTGRRPIRMEPFIVSARKYRPQQFEDVVGRHFRQPPEGLGNDNTPSSHMWRTLRRPCNTL